MLFRFPRYASVPSRKISDGFPVRAVLPSRQPSVMIDSSGSEQPRRKLFYEDVQKWQQLRSDRILVETVIEEAPCAMKVQYRGYPVRLGSPRLYQFSL